MAVGIAQESIVKCKTISGHFSIIFSLQLFPVTLELNTKNKKNYTQNTDKQMTMYD